MAPSRLTYSNARSLCTISTQAQCSWLLSVLDLHNEQAHQCLFLIRHQTQPSATGCLCAASAQVQNVRTSIRQASKILFSLRIPPSRFKLQVSMCHWRTRMRPQLHGQHSPSLILSAKFSYCKLQNIQVKRYDVADNNSGGQHPCFALESQVA